MRLRIGVTNPIAPNALVYATDVKDKDRNAASSAIAGLAVIGVRDGMTIGKWFGFTFTLVLNLS